MKGIKMILGALAAASLLVSVSANAQENTKRGAYETNKAFDNTFIGIGAGINASIMHPSQPKTWGNLGLAADVTFGKWWTPAVGARLGYHGMWNNSKQAFNASGIDADTPFGFHYFHGDILWNISNSIAGYKADRFWDFAPYATMGLLSVNKSRTPFAKTTRNREWAGGLGLLNILHVTERVNVTLDLMVLAGKGSAYSTDSDRVALFPSATIGLAFNLCKTTFDRHSEITPVVVPVPFTVEQYNSLAEKAAALEKENAALRDKAAQLEKQLAPYRQLVNGQTYLYDNGTFTAVDVKAGSPLTLYFDCGSTQLSAREKAHLEFFTQSVLTPDTKLSINGYADKQTGSAKRNQKLSEQRVKTVVDLLKKAGASEENMECAAHGATIQLFNGAAKNRVVTIEIK